MRRDHAISVAILSLLMATGCSGRTLTPADGGPTKGPDATGTGSCMCPSGDSFLALPPDLPALPTFVDSDTCQAFLARGGVSVRTQTPKDCKIQVTLANGEVLTTTASFEPLPICCSSGFILAATSPFQASNTGAPDAAPHDGSHDARFEEWWYPACGTPANNCPETCAPVQVIAAPAVCGPYETLMVGCVPRDLVVAGWFCLMRRSNGEIIFTEEGPSNRADFEMCPPQIEGNIPRVPSTCPDASAP
jgi:hypothetical protein